MIRVSTALRNALLGWKPSYSATTISADASSKQFRDSANQFLLQGFRPGDIIYSTVTSNVGYFTVTQVTAGAITVSETVVDTSAGSSFTLSVVNSKNFKDLMKYAVLDIYSGAQPASADVAETGTKLLSITVDGGSFTAGQSTNGLQFDSASGGEIQKSASQIWRGAGLAVGTAGWFRLYDNGYLTGADSSPYQKIRLDGSVGISGADLNLSSINITVGAVTQISEFELEWPASV